MTKERARETVEVALKSTFEAVAEMNADHEEFERALTVGSIKHAGPVERRLVQSAAQPCCLVEASNHH